MFHVKAVGAVVELWQVHGAQTKTNRPSKELLGVHHFCSTEGEKRRCSLMQYENAKLANDILSSADVKWPWLRKTQPLRRRGRGEA